MVTTVNTKNKHQESEKASHFSGGLEFTGAIGQSRTDDPLLRRQMLYPTELQPQCNVLIYYNNNRIAPQEQAALPFIMFFMLAFSALFIQ